MTQIIREFTGEGSFDVRGAATTFERRLEAKPNEASNQSTWVLTNWGAVPELVLRCGGVPPATSKNPNLLTTGQAVGAITTHGWTGAAFQICGAMSAVSAENFTPTAMGTQVRLAGALLGGIGPNPTTFVRAEATVTADDTGFGARDVSAAAVKVWRRGAVDSGGAGFRELRITN